MTPLTKEQWDQLGDKPRWDVIVALRGPDIPHSETLKWFTTSVIRGKVRKVMRVGGLVNQHLGMVVLPKHPHELMELPTTLKGIEDVARVRWSPAHFLQHVAEAADWLSIPVLYIPNDVWMQAMHGGSARAAAKSILAAVPKSHDNQTLLDELEHHLPTIY
jgi:hypothetical protein